MIFGRRYQEPKSDMAILESSKMYVLWAWLDDGRLAFLETVERYRAMHRSNINSAPEASIINLGILPYRYRAVSSR